LKVELSFLSKTKPRNLNLLATGIDAYTHLDQGRRLPSGAKKNACNALDLEN